MKSVMQILLVFGILPSTLIQLAAAQIANAKDALYIVPTAPDLVQFSRFNIRIVEPYENQLTEKISYEFPEILVGQKNKIIEFAKIPGTVNSWQAPEAEAHCSTLADIFSCNIHLNKNVSGGIVDAGIPGEVLVPNALSKDLALENLKNMTMPQNEFLGFTQVVEDFFSNKPAGILMYEI
jgi:hypothetical protein